MEKRKTNLEVYGKEILEYLGKYGAVDFAINKKTEELLNCDDGAFNCVNCIFTDGYLCCSEREKWFHETYNDPRVIELEKAVLTILEKGYLVRDEYDQIVFSLEELLTEMEEKI